MAAEFVIEGLKATIEGKEILKGINLQMKGGEIHAVMGPNGTGKSTLASALMGHLSMKSQKAPLYLKGRPPGDGSGRTCPCRIIPRDAISE